MSSTSSSPLVADLELARQLERAEGLSNRQFVLARAQVFPQSHVDSKEVAGAQAMFDGVDSPCTQTFGLGMFGPVSTSELDKIEEFFDRCDAATNHEVCPLCDQAAAWAVGCSRVSTH